MGTPCTTHHGPLGGPDLPHPGPHTHSTGGVTVHRPRQRRALGLCMILTTATMVVELAGGLWTGSLMLLADGAHMLSHAVALGVSWLAIWFAARPRGSRTHYGLHRAEILGSFLNGLGLLVFTGWILYEASGRLADPELVHAPEMMAIAALGLVVNLATAWILARSGAEDLNTRSAFLHMLGDLFSSVAIVLGGILLLATGWAWIDPALSMVVALVVLVWGLGLVREAGAILLEMAPRGIDPAQIRRDLIRDVPGVHDVHDLHVWEITSGYVCLTAHVVVDDYRISHLEDLRSKACRLLGERFHVAHVTLQLEAS